MPWDLGDEATKNKVGVREECLEQGKKVHNGCLE